MKKELSSLILFDKYYYNDSFYLLYLGSNVDHFNEPVIIKGILHFSFKPILFNKKNFLIFLLLLELLTFQKPILTFSKKNIIFLKLRKGSITGCKVTLRKKYLNAFLDQFISILPKLNKNLFLFNQNKLKNRFYAFNIIELYIFKNIERFLTLDTKYLDLMFVMNTFFYQHLIFILGSYFFPIELSSTKNK